MPSTPSFLINDSVQKVALLPLSRNAYIMIVLLLDFERISTGITAIAVLGHASLRSRLLCPSMVVAYNSSWSLKGTVIRFSKGINGKQKDGV